VPNWQLHTFIQVYIPSIDKDELLKELRALLTDAAPGKDQLANMSAIAKVLGPDADADNCRCRIPPYNACLQRLHNISQDLSSAMVSCVCGVVRRPWMTPSWAT
jgi:hypothetical protein